MLTTPPPSFAEGFWTKGLEFNGIWVLGNGQLPDEAVYRAAEIVFNSIAGMNPAVLAKLVQNGARFVVIPEGVKITDLPHYDDLTPVSTWENYRGLGGVVGRPTSSAGEENILNYPSDIYHGSESIALHEWMHAVERIGLQFGLPALDAQVTAAYNHAVANNLWDNTYAGTNAQEYFAETVQSFFDNNPDLAVANGVHNTINTRAELQAYDPVMYNLLVTLFGNTTWRPGSFFGSVANNSMSRTVGANLMFGNGGNDYLVGAAGNDRLIGGIGDDTLSGGAGNDLLEGEAGNDLLNARSGNDTLLAGAGNDTLMGKAGKDTMRGGSGNDVFAYSLASESRGANIDIVKDFDDLGDDRFDFSALSAATLTWRKARAFTDIDQVRIKDIAGPDLLVEINLSGNAAPEMTIRLSATTLASMTPIDFIF